MVPEPLIEKRAAIALVAVATLVVVLRLPTTLDTVAGKRAQNDAYTGIGRTLAAADSLDVDNAFVATSLEVLPDDATYVVLRPRPEAVTTGRIAGITYDALRPYMRYVLLPRRPASFDDAEYILCYACGRDVRGVRWVWKGENGMRIGRRGGG